MSSQRVLALVLLTAVLAFVAGRVSAPKKRLPSSTLASLSSTASASASASDSAPERDDAVVGDDEDLDIEVVVARLQEQVKARDGEVRRLQGEVQRLQVQVKDVEAAQNEAEGKPVPFPEGKDKASEEQALVSTLQAALAGQGLDGEVSAVDCNEYPCIAHGKIAGVHDSELNGAVAAAKQKLGGLPYVSFNRFVDDKDPQKSQTTFSIALYPEGLPDDEQQNLNKRMRSRKNAYADASP